MKKHIKTAVLLFSAAFLFFSYSAVLAQDSKNFGLDATVGVGENQKALIPPSKNAPSDIAGRVVGTILSFVGVIFFVLIFYSGLRWMLAQGDEGVIDKAKQTIIAAVFGLIIILAAYAITAFIGGQLTKTN